MVLIACSSSTDQVVERVVSNDGEFWATVSVNRGSALEYDWYGVAVGKVHPTWSDSVLRRAVRGFAVFKALGAWRYLGLVPMKSPSTAIIVGKKIFTFLNMNGRECQLSTFKCSAQD